MLIWKRRSQELLRSWNLPDAVVASARWHHQPGKAPESHRQLTDLTHVADSLCIRMGWGMGRDGLLYKMDEEAFARLQITPALAEEVMVKVTQGLEELKDMFQIHPAGKPRPDKVPSS